MKVFLSYSSKDKKIAEEIYLAILGAEYEVFFDQSSLPPGGDYHSRIRKGIEESDAFIFLISPNSVKDGGYVLTELELAKEKWPSPKEVVLPVMIEPTNSDLIDSYLMGVTYLEPRGNVAAEVVHALPKLLGKKRKMALWTSTPVKIGAISAVLGILLSGAAAFKLFKPDEEDPIGKRETILRLKELEPKLEMSYIIMDQSIYYSDQTDSIEKKSQLLFLDYPLLRNEIASESNEESMQTEAVFEDTGYSRITYLVLQNKGKTTPLDVQIILKRYVISDKITIEESPGTPTPDYEMRIRDKKNDLETRIFSLPTPLETGQGILIPLFVSSQYYDTLSVANRSWTIISKIVYIPDRVIYTDPLDEKKKEVKIRAMKDPVRIANGIEGRG